MSELPRQDFKIRLGDDLTLKFTTVDGAGAAKSLAGAMAIDFKMAKTVGAGQDTLAKALLDGVAVTNAAGGLFEVELDDADITALYGDFYYQIRVTDSAGRTQLVAWGTITIERARA